MKLLILSILLSAPSLCSSSLLTQEQETTVAAMPDYNAYRIHKMRTLLDLKTTPKMFRIRIA